MAKYALVLGGGGYAGTAFHAGVVTALARAGWDPAEAAVVVGTSAGATTAALLGAGFPAREYVSLVLQHRLSAQARTVMAGIGQLKPAPRMPRPRLRPAAPGLAGRALRPSAGLPFGVLLAAATPAGTVDVNAVSPGYGPQFSAWPQRPCALSSSTSAVAWRIRALRPPCASPAQVSSTGRIASSRAWAARYLPRRVSALAARW